MRMVEEFTIRKIGGKTVAVGIRGEALHFGGMITLNETGEFLFRHLQQDTTEEALCAALTQEYDVTAQQALQDTREFLAILHENGLLIGEENTK